MLKNQFFALMRYVLPSLGKNYFILPFFRINNFTNIFVHTFALVNNRQINKNSIKKIDKII